ncbi:MAG: MATE family efflux transporter [Polyangiaceae bacterium]
MNDISTPASEAAPTATAPSSAPPPRGFWATVREAIHGSELDFTRVPVSRAVLLLAVPMVLEMVMESLFAVVDIFWVSRLGSHAVAAVGLTESMLSILYAVAMGISSASTALVARRIGEQNPEDAAKTAVQAIAFGTLSSLFFGAIGAIFAAPLLTAMGAEPETVKIGTGYTAVMLGGNVTILMLFIVNAIFRGAGDAATAMRTLWIANMLNIVLGPCFIFGWGPCPELGVMGAAVATTLCRGIGVAYQLFSLARGKRIAIARRHLRFDAEKMVALLKIASTGALQTLIETASWLGLVRILARFGSASLAGYTIGVRILIFALLPSWGLANAAATLVGQNLGANEPARAQRAVWLTALYNFIFLTSVAVIFVALPEPIVRWFTNEPDVVPYAVDCLRIVALGFMFFAIGMVTMQAFNGAGDTVTPSIINFTSFWLVKIPLAYVLAIHLDMGPHGVFVAVTFAYGLQTLIAVTLFRRGKWKLKKV